MTDKVSVRTSYSQNNTYIACPAYWQAQYKEKWFSLNEGAALYFGSAIDHAVTELLKSNAVDFVKLFKEKWFSTIKDKQVFQIFDNDNLVYSNSDFDEDVLTNSDQVTMLGWSNELHLFGHDPIRIFKEIQAKKRNPYKHPTKEELKYFNRVSWLCLEQKGILLLNAFNTQFVPKIEKVIDTQKYVRLEDGLDSITGVIDMVLQIEGYKDPVIFDLKTAAQPYKASDLEMSQQLTLYAAMKAKEYNTQNVGYVVLCKNIPKVITNTCLSCGHVAASRHQTCNALTSTGSRCNGAWKEVKVLKPEVQVMVGVKTENDQLTLLTDYANIIEAMRNNIIYKNSSKCLNWWGSRCIFFDKCWNGSTEGLVKRDK
jgi:hypothetical protein